MSVIELYKWYKENHGKAPDEFAIITDEDWRYVKGLADGLQNEDLKKIALRIKEHARFFRVLNQYYYAELDTQKKQQPSAKTQPHQRINGKI